MTERERAQEVFNRAAIRIFMHGATEARLVDLKEKWNKLAATEYEELKEDKFIIDMQGSISFGDAFYTARRLGADEFTWWGKNYHTMTVEEHQTDQLRKHNKINAKRMVIIA